MFGWFYFQTGGSVNLRHEYKYPGKGKSDYEGGVRWVHKINAEYASVCIEL